MFSREQVEAIENFVNAIIDNRKRNADCGDAVRLHEIRESLINSDTIKLQPGNYEMQANFEIMLVELEKSKAPTARDWWNNLSINQQKDYHLRNFPNLGSYLITANSSWVEAIWQREGKPNPQELTPIPKEFQ